MDVTNNDVLKHYLSSVLVYGITLLILLIMPMFSTQVLNPYFSYFTVLLVYYLLYVIFAYPIFFKFHPKSILQSRNVKIINYFKRQFAKKTELTEQLKNIKPTEDEKQAFMILFIKAFFGGYCLSLLCNKYLPQLGYDFDFLSTMWRQVSGYFADGHFVEGFCQFLDDTTDMWLTLMFTLSTFVLSFSYLTETEIFKNKIRYADTSFLGIFSCLMCYYPFTVLTEKIFPVAMKDVIPVENYVLRITLYVLVLFINIFATLSILRLGTKAGNLTNRGIVTSFPYSVVRHPEYSMKMFYIILTMVPVYVGGTLNILGNIIFTIGLVMWILVYIIRAITEERNLIKDEEYKNYTEKVKYRFIPFVI